MSLNKRGGGRHPLKQREIAMYFTREIKSGRLQPGSLLPPREELKSLFDTTSTTIQRTVDHLVKEGMLETIPRRGTFISRRPPCLHRIGVVFASCRGDGGWRGIDEALYTLAHRQSKTQHGFQLVTYEGCEPRQGRSPDLRTHLIEDVELGRLAGLVFSSTPFYLSETPVLDDETVFRTGFQAPSKNYAFPVVNSGGPQFVPKALGRLRKEGCKRVGVICQPGIIAERAKRVSKVMAEEGFTYEPAWIQAMLAHELPAAEHLMRLLFQGKAADRPDSLIIMDDNLVPGVQQGLKALGMEAGKDLTLIAHCNFTDAKPSTDGVVRLGYDIRDMLTTCFDRIQAQSQDAPFPMSTVSTPLFEWELEA
jgi:DNA-binding LacI/PurR family transcriptional regulator